MQYETGKGITSLTAEDLAYEKVKDHIFVTVQNAEKNRDMLEEVLHERWEDLALAYRIQVSLPENGRAYIWINRALLDRWGIEETTLKETAWRNMHSRHSPVFRSMNELVRDMGLPAFPLEECGLQIYVLSNQENDYGAVYMFDQEVMQGIAEKLDADLVVLPCSRHEVIVLKEIPDMDFDDLRDIVKEVNRTELKPEDILSNNVYHYSRESQTLSMIKGSGQEETMSLTM